LARISVKDLLKAGVHYGHRTSRWNPKMKPFIFGKRNGIHIIDLKATLRGIIRARRFLYEVARQGGDVLFVGTKRPAAAVIRQQVIPHGIPYVADRWLGGMLTNFKTVRKSLGRLEELEALEESGEIENYSKKMIAALQREKRKILRNLEGVRFLDEPPAAVVLIDPRREKIARREAARLGIATLALIDTDCDPTEVDISVPCNEDAIRSVQVVLRPLVEAVVEGKEARVAEAAVEMAPEAAPPEAAAPQPKPKAPPEKPTPAPPEPPASQETPPAESEAATEAAPQAEAAPSTEAQPEPSPAEEPTPEEPKPAAQEQAAPAEVESAEPAAEETETPASAEDEA
jgi:small subunit ribosomal protein S2